MSTGTSIAWTDATWSPVTGCTRVSAGCDNCYSVRLTHRLEKMGQRKYTGLTVLNPSGDRHFNGVVKCHEDELTTPLRWKKPRRVFVNSMSDTFHKDVPFEFIDKMFAVMALCRQHTFQVLTKRPERMAEYLRLQILNDRCLAWRSYGHFVAGGMKEAVNYAAPLPNVWLGTSVENELAAHRIDQLRGVPAAVRFLSIEPLIGPLSPLDLKGIHWVIIGGESGPGARPCHIEWIRDIIAQCKAAGVSCFVKQLGSRPIYDGTFIDPRLYLNDPKGGDPDEWPADLRVREFPKT